MLARAIARAQSSRMLESVLRCARSGSNQGEWRTAFETPVVAGAQGSTAKTIYEGNMRILVTDLLQDQDMLVVETNAYVRAVVSLDIGDFQTIARRAYVGTEKTDTMVAIPDPKKVREVLEQQGGPGVHTSLQAGVEARDLCSDVRPQLQEKP